MMSEPPSAPETHAPEPNVPLLRVRDLVTSFRTDSGVIRAVDGVSFDVQAGQTVGVVGESGCGKSVTALSLLRLIPSPPGRIESGAIELRGQDLLKLRERDMREVRGNEISMVFQEPMTSLNPVYTVGAQIVEAIRLHQQLPRREAYARAEELLRHVGIPSPETNVDAYPHQLSGGMRQRVMIAMALACRPALLIADEPTTALDVTVQRQILDLLREVNHTSGAACLLVSHDIAVIASVCERIIVMYGGIVVEDAPAETAITAAAHPYTGALVAAVPTMNVPRDLPLATIVGRPPDPANLPPGCPFSPRCPRADDQCHRELPLLQPVHGREHSVACWHPHVDDRTFVQVAP